MFSIRNRETQLNAFKFNCIYICVFHDCDPSMVAKLGKDLANHDGWCSIPLGNR
jgi:hypothetical protein